LRVAVEPSRASDPRRRRNGSELKLLLRGARPDPDWPNDLDELRASLTVEERSWNG